MKVDFTAPILDLSGQPVMDQNGKPAFVGPLIEAALFTIQNQISAEDSIKRFDLAMKVHDGSEITISDAMLIKEVCARVYGPLAFGRIVAALEGAGPEPRPRRGK